MPIPSKALRMQHLADPKEEILSKVGNLKEFKPYHNYILVGTYVRPKITAGGIHLADTTRSEDLYQGKIGLVLLKGPLAFVDDENNKFGGQNVEIGDWVVYRASDGMEMLINGQHCRVLQEAHIVARVDSPDMVL